MKVDTCYYAEFNRRARTRTRPYRCLDGRNYEQFEIGKGRCFSMKKNSNEGRVEGRPFDLDPLIDAIADRVAVKVIERLPTSAASDSPLLLTVEQAAIRLGRTVPAIEHLIHKRRLIAVRIDRRVMLDERDILALIDESKN
jgi:hypothetical protein